MRRIFRAGGLVSAAVLVFGYLVGLAGPAEASVIPGSGVYYELFTPRVSATECLDVPSASTSSGTILQMFHCHGYASNGANQLWTFVHVSDGSYQIENKNSRLCVTPQPGLNGVSGTLLEQATCDFFAGQEWRLLSDPASPDTRFLLQNDTYTSMCLALQNGSGADHTQVWLQSCAFGIAVQTWQLG